MAVYTYSGVCVRLATTLYQHSAWRVDHCAVCQKAVLTLAGRV